MQLPQVCGVDEHSLRCNAEQFGAKEQFTLPSKYVTMPLNCFTSSTEALLRLPLLPTILEIISSALVC
jgi:hypothetical protein